MRWKGWLMMLMTLVLVLVVSKFSVPGGEQLFVLRRRCCDVDHDNPTGSFTRDRIPIHLGFYISRSIYSELIPFHHSPFI